MQDSARPWSRDDLMEAASLLRREADAAAAAADQPGWRADARRKIRERAGRLSRASAFLEVHAND